MKTILITGCSSGFGLEAARLFLERGWNVIATMRAPNESLLTKSERLRVLALDVADDDSIRRIVDEAGPIDVLVNNAGIGLMSVFEGTPLQTVRATFETNLFGAMALTQAFVPTLRERRGVIVNVSSTVTLKTLPLLSVYTASKAALNAWSAGLALELAPLGVQVRVVLPGQSRATPFGQNAFALMQAHGVSVPEAYADLHRGVMECVRAGSPLVTQPIDVAEAIWRAATDPDCPARQPAGADAVEWFEGRG